MRFSMRDISQRVMRNLATLAPSSFVSSPRSLFVLLWTILQSGWAASNLKQTKQIEFNKFLVSGSSTVLPIVDRWLDWLKRIDEGSAYFHNHEDEDEALLQHYKNNLGSSEGASQLCKGEVEIGAMSRNWQPSEAMVEQLVDDQRPTTYMCRDNHLRAAQVTVALDGITFFVRRGGAAHRCVRRSLPISLEQLKWIFMEDKSENARCKLWSDLVDNRHPECAQACIERWAPDRKSGTLQVFEDAINTSFDTRNKAMYNASENDSVIVDGVMASEHAIGFSGYGSVHREIGRLSLVPLVSGIDEMFCALTAVGSNPLARALYMNINLPASPRAWDFLRFGFSDTGQQLVEDSGFCRLSSISVMQYRHWIGGVQHYLLDTVDLETHASSDTILIHTALLAFGVFLGVVASLLWRHSCQKQIRAGLIANPQSMAFWDDHPTLIGQRCFSDGSADTLASSERLEDVDSPIESNAVREGLRSRNPFRFVEGQPSTTQLAAVGINNSSLIESEAPCRFIVNADFTHLWLEAVSSFLVWADVRALQLVNVGASSSTKETSCFLSLLERAQAATAQDSYLTKAIQLWQYGFPHLAWVADGSLSPQKIVALLWALGVQATRDNADPWHREIAIILLQNRGLHWPWQERSFYFFLHGGGLTKCERYCAWAASNGGHLDLLSADLVALMMDLDPGIGTPSPVPTSAIQCAQGLVAGIQIRERFFVYPQPSVEYVRRLRPNAMMFGQPVESLLRFTALAIGIEGSQSSEGSSSTS